MINKEHNFLNVSGVFMEHLLDMITKYYQLDQETLEDLYDQVDNLYNELVTRYLEAISSPSDNKEIVDKIIGYAKSLIAKRNRTIEEDLILIAILDVIATDLHYRLYGESIGNTMEE